MKKLFIFTVTDIDEMLRKGNIWYFRHYEAYFDKVYAVYILGTKQKPITNGNTTLVPIGTGSILRDLFSSPYRLYKLAKEIKPSKYLTADPLFLWWTSALIKGFLKAKIYFLPVCMPELLYKNKKSRMPVWIKKIFSRLTLLAANQVITSKNFSGYIDWLKSERSIRNKLLIVDMVVDEMPTLELYEALKNRAPRVARDEHVLLYVGRLHHEKMVDDILMAFAHIQKSGLNTVLRIIGDGQERASLEKMATELGVRNKVDFLGSKPNGELAQYYNSTDVFVSPLTGSALREAALFRLPVVAYDIDWVRGFLIHEKNALLIANRDIEGMAKQIIRILRDKKLAKKISESLYLDALERWDISKIGIALKQTFETKDNNMGFHDA